MDGQGITLARHHAVGDIAAHVAPGMAPAIEAALVAGDLKGLNAEARIAFYRAICTSVGLNPLTRPLEYIVLNGKLTLYARKDACDQLRAIHGVSIEILSREFVDTAYVVRSRATLASGRQDESLGVVDMKGLAGESKANAMMKAETKAKRRVTLSICGLGMLDETEIDRVSKPRYQYLAEDSGAAASVAGEAQPVRGAAPTPETSASAAGTAPDTTRALVDDVDIMRPSSYTPKLSAEDIADILQTAADAGMSRETLDAGLAARGNGELKDVYRTAKPRIIEWITSRRWEKKGKK